MRTLMLLVIMLPLTFVACAEKNDSAPQQVAVAPAPTPAPPPTSCVDGTVYCNSNLYRRYVGFTAYPRNPYFYNLNFAGGYMGNFCNCPYGHRPVYNAQMGLGCVNTMKFRVYAGGALYWGYYGADNNQWVNVPQISNTQGYPRNGCYEHVAQACFVDQANACGAGFICQPTGGGSRLGICLTPNTVSSAGPNTSGYR